MWFLAIIVLVYQLVKFMVICVASLVVLLYKGVHFLVQRYS